jgi:hypothetical protein
MKLKLSVELDGSTHRIHIIDPETPFSFRDDRLWWDANTDYYIVSTGGCAWPTLVLVCPSEHAYVTGTDSAAIELAVELDKAMHLSWEDILKEATNDGIDTSDDEAMQVWLYEQDYDQTAEGVWWSDPGDMRVWSIAPEDLIYELED